eukprot:s861_g12.t1
MASIEDGIRSRISEFQLQELASAIWTFGEMQLLDPPLFAAVYSASLDKGLKTADGSLAVMTLSALARLKDPKLALLCYSQLEDLGGSAKGLGPLLAQAELEEHKEQHAQGESDASAASVSVAPLGYRAYSGRRAAVAEGGRSFVARCHSAVWGPGGPHQIGGRSSKGRSGTGGSSSTVGLR